MATRYAVQIRDTTGAPVALLTSWRNLQYTLRVNDADSSVLELDDVPAGAPQSLLFDSALFDMGNFGSPFSPDMLPVSGHFGTDYLIEVWRWDADATPVIAPYQDYQGFHRTPVRQVTADGDALFTSYGVGLLDLLARRGVWWPSGSAGSDKTGPGETVIKAFVDENAGPGATVAAGRAADGVTTGLVVEPDMVRGVDWTGSRAWTGLLETVQEVGRATDLDFGMLRQGPADFLFRVKERPWGMDRSTQGLNVMTGRNAAGNVPVVFALGFANMGEPVYSLNRTAEVNAVLVLGQGLEAMRQTVERTDTMAIAASPWNRHEATRNANQESAVEALQSVGDAALLELAARESFQFAVLQTGAYRWGRDYGLGDLVSARFGDIERHYQITEVTVQVQAGNEQIGVTVSNVRSG